MEEILNLLDTFGGAASSLSGIIVLVGTILTMSKRTRDIVRKKLQDFVGISELKNDFKEHVDSNSSNKEKLEKLEKGMQCTLRKDIVRHCNSCISAEHITPEDLEALNAEFESYTNLGGNMFVHDYVEKAKQLPIKDGPSLFKGF